MLTARGRPEDVLRGFESGADDYLPKPFELSVLLARVRGLLRRREWFNQEAGGRRGCGRSRCGTPKPRARRTEPTPSPSTERPSTSPRWSCARKGAPCA